MAMVTCPNCGALGVPTAQEACPSCNALLRASAVPPPLPGQAVAMVHRERMAPLSGRGKAVVLLLWLIMFAFLASGVIDLLRVQRGDRFQEAAQDERELLPASLEEMDSWTKISSTVEIAIYVLAVIAFLTWIHRAHENLAPTGIRNLKYSPGWAVGGFFVPILNLLRPYQVMEEITNASKALARSPLKVPVSAWWGVWLASGLLGQVSSRLFHRAKEMDDLISASWFSIATNAVKIVSALLAISVVSKVTSLQEQARADVTPLSRAEAEAFRPVATRERWRSK